MRRPGAHLGGDDAGQRRLAQPGRAGEEDVVDRLAALPGRLEHDGEVLDQLGLADELGRGTAGRRPDLLELLVGGPTRPGRRPGARRPRRRRSAPSASASTARTSRRALGLTGWPARAGPAGASLPRRHRRVGRRAHPGSRRARSRARSSAARASAREVRDAGSAVSPRPRPRAGRARSGRSSRLFSSIISRAAVLRPTPGHGAQRLDVVLEHGGRQRGRREHRHDGERQRRADPVRAEQHLEAASLVVVHEAVEDDGVLAHVGVHVQRRLVPGPAGHQRGRRRGVTVTR